MLDLFYGEFLLHPAPLEVSGNTCSHSCAYCFSNIRCNKRIANVTGFVNSMKKQKENTLSGALLKNGYSICLSNRTDPFSKSNDVVTDTYVKYLANIENGIFIQTKGGESLKKHYDYLSSMGKNNIVSYFTITSRRDDILKKIEPGAPAYDERLEQIKYAIKLGHLVIVAFNPLCENWMSSEDHDLTFKEMTDAGVKHFIYQRLHMNTSDVKRFTDDRRSRFGNELERAVKRNSTLNGQLYLQENLLKNINSDYNVLAFGMPYKTNFFIEVRKKLGKCFPSSYDFINYCYESGTGVYTVDDYIKSLGTEKDPIFNTEFKSMSAYILRVARNAWKGNPEAQGVKTLNDVIKMYWKDRRISGSPQNNLLFQKVENESGIKLFFDGEIHRESRGISV